MDFFVYSRDAPGAEALRDDAGLLEEHWSKILATFAALLLLLAAVAAGCGTDKSANQAGRPPALRVEAARDVRVRGTNFQPGEQVQVTLSGAVQRTGKASASGSGTFTVDFGHLRRHRCTGLVVTVSGSLGSHAVARGLRLVCAPV